jgi:DNA-binding IclR family transcriptional regulator
MLNTEPPSVNNRIQSIDRAVELLEAIAGAPEPETAPALADRCRLNRSTAWRILATLEHHGLVERDPDSNRYSLGFAVLKLAAAAGHEPLVRLAHPVLRRLADATGETVNVAVARRLELVYADQVQARHVMAPNWLGHTVPLHATSTGKSAPGSSASPTRRSPSPPRCAPSWRASASGASRSRTASWSRRCGASPPPRATRPAAPPR